MGTTAQNLRTFPKSSVARFGRKQKLWRAFLILFGSHCLRWKIASLICLDLISFWISFCRPRALQYLVVHQEDRTHAPEEYSSPGGCRAPQNTVHRRSLRVLPRIRPRIRKVGQIASLGVDRQARRTPAAAVGTEPQRQRGTPRPPDFFVHFGTFPCFWLNGESTCCAKWKLESRQTCTLMNSLARQPLNARYRMAMVAD